MPESDGKSISSRKQSQETAAFGGFSHSRRALVRIGYARVSTQDQNLDLQRDALRQAGCEKVITDTASGAKAARPGLDKVRELLRAGDTLVVWRLDRLGRSLKDLIASVAWLEEQGVALVSLQETIDTSTPAGRLTFHLFGALAEFERNLIRERTQAGLTAARARGRRGGAPYKMTAAKLRLAQSAMGTPETRVSALCKELGVSTQTLYRHVSPLGELRPDGIKLLERRAR